MHFFSVSRAQLSRGSHVCLDRINSSKRNTLSVCRSRERQHRRHTNDTTIVTQTQTDEQYQCLSQVFFCFFFIQVKSTQSRASWTYMNQFKTYTPMHDTVQKCSKVIIRSAPQRKQNPTHRKIVPNHFFQAKAKMKTKESRFKCIWSLNGLSERHHFFF